MFSFKEFIVEDSTAQSPKTLHAFDMDETLFAHDHHILRVHVVDRHGRRVRSLTNQEFNTHNLPPDHKYDFSEFRSSEVFGKSAKPIRSMLAKMKAIHKNGGKVEILTARSDLDDKDRFAHHMRKYGIDIDKIHVRRAGNIEGKKAAEAKKQVMHDLIAQHGYKKVHLYDDSHDNLEKFLSLKSKHKEVEFHAHHVQHNPETGEVKLTTTSEVPKPPKEKKND
jgi:hypothetical protein